MDIKQWGTTLVKFFCTSQSAGISYKCNKMFSRNWYKLSEHFGTTCKKVLRDNVQLYIVFEMECACTHVKYGCFLSWILYSDYGYAKPNFDPLEGPCVRDNGVKIPDPCADGTQKTYNASSGWGNVNTESAHMYMHIVHVDIIYMYIAVLGHEGASEGARSCHVFL